MAARAQSHHTTEMVELSHTLTHAQYNVLRSRYSGNVLATRKRDKSHDHNAAHIHQRIRQSHQIIFTVRSPDFQIYPNLYFTSIHVPDAEVLARRPIGKSITSDINYSIL